MGWGTLFTVELEISKETYKSIEEVEDKLKEVDEDIEGIKTRLKMFASSTPKDLIPDDWKEESIRYLNNLVGDELDYLEESLYKKFLLENLISTWKEDSSKITTY